MVLNVTMEAYLAIQEIASKGGTGEDVGIDQAASMMEEKLGMEIWQGWWLLHKL